jgi:hypothetical protein
LPKLRHCGILDFGFWILDCVLARVRNPKSKIANLECPWWVGERCVGGEAVRVSERGAYASENVGISNEKTGENPVRRKPKVS